MTDEWNPGDGWISEVIDLISRQPRPAQQHTSANLLLDHTSCTPFASTTFQLVYIHPSAAQNPISTIAPWGCTNTIRRTTDVTLLTSHVELASTACASYPCIPHEDEDNVLASLPLAGVPPRLLLSSRSYLHISIFINNVCVKKYILMIYWFRKYFSSIILQQTRRFLI